MAKFERQKRKPPRCRHQHIADMLLGEKSFRYLKSECCLIPSLPMKRQERERLFLNRKRLLTGDSLLESGSSLISLIWFVCCVLLHSPPICVFPLFSSLFPPLPITFSLLKPSQIHIVSLSFQKKR